MIRGCRGCQRVTGGQRQLQGKPLTAFFGGTLEEGFEPLTILRTGTIASACGPDRVGHGPKRGSNLGVRIGLVWFGPTKPGAVDQKLGF